MDTKIAFTVDEAARQASLGRDRIYAAIRDGRLEARKAGRRTVVTADAIKRFINALPALKLPQEGDR